MISALSLVLLLFLPAGPQGLQDDVAPLVVSQDHSWPPFSFIDDEGEPRGILIDLWRAIGEEMGRPVEFRLADWNESIQQVVRGEAMVHGGLIESPDRREILSFGADLFPLSAVLYIRSNQLILSVDQLGSRMIGVVEGSFELEHLVESYPDLERRLFANNADMVRAAAAGDIDAFVVDHPVGIYLLERHAEPGDFHVLEALYTQQLRWATGTGDDLLSADIAAALAALPPDELTRISQRWITTERVEAVPAWFWPAVVAGCLFFLLLLLAGYAWILLIRKSRLEDEVEARTASLRYEQARLRNVIEGAGLGTWEASVPSKTMHIDEGWARMLGYSREELDPLTREAWADLVHPKDLPAAEEAMRAHLAGEVSSYTAEFRMRHRNGSWIWIHSSGRLLANEDGSAPTRMYGCYVNIHEERTLTQQVHRAQRMEGIGTLAGGVAHDVNNILTPILLSMDFLKRPDLTTTERLEIVDSIEEGARRGADIVGQVLSYARGDEASRRVLHVLPVIAGLERMLGDTLPRLIEFRVQASSDVPPIEADPTQLRQILLNLILNSRDALFDQAGRIEVEVDAMRSEDQAGPGHLRIRVSDNGCGMSPDVMERIFDPFFTTKEPGRGTGLGLSTTLSLVQANAGTIDVESVPGRGTRFTLSFPAADPSRLEAETKTPAREATSLEASGSRQPSMDDGTDPQETDHPDMLPARDAAGTVLLVDDEPGILASLERTLSRIGFDVITAPDGRTGLRLFREHGDRIDLVITDIMMPVMSGDEMILKIKAFRPDTRVLAMSGLVQDDGLRADLDLPDLHFLDKPFSLPELLDAVGECLASGTAERGT